MSNSIVYDEFLNGFNRNNAREYEAAIQRMYMRKLFEISVNRFKWVGLPDSIDPRFLETTLFYNALSVFYFDDNYLKYLSLRGTPAGVIDYQDNPTGFMVVGNQFVSKTLTTKNCVPIWANYSRMPDTDIVNVYARKLAKLDRTLEINTDNARQTRILVVDSDTQLAMENVNRQIDEGTPTLRVGRNLEPYVNSLDMGIDSDMFADISTARNREWNNCMTLLGIDNVSQDKKERLVAAEVAGNQAQIETIKATNLNTRKFAARQINEMFGLAVDVSYAVDNDEQMNTVFSYNEEINNEFRKIMAGE